MKVRKNRFGKVWVNVASGVYGLEDYINLENHMFLTLSSLYPALKYLIPSKYHHILNSYRESKSTFKMVKYNCRKPLRFSSGSVDHIVSSHFLEHIYRDDVTVVLKGFFKVLKPDATLHIIIPDLNAIVMEYIHAKDIGNKFAADELLIETVLSRKNQGSLMYRLIEFTGNHGIQHYCMYDKESMTKIILQAGFCLVEADKVPSNLYKVGDHHSIHIYAKKPT